MADLPLDVPASVQIVDPATGQPTQTLAQWMQAVQRALRDLRNDVDEL